MPENTRPTDRPLSRFTVIELTMARAGPFCGRQLADWGANVIKIETPEGVAGPDNAGHGARRVHSDYQNLHRNRRMITLNLKEEAGRETLMRMVDKADVLIENFRPDVKQRLGYDYETLSARNPGIVLVSISGFGQDGPYAKRPGVDQIAQGMSGLMSLTGEPGGRPMRTGIAIADVCTGLMASFGALAALHEREVSGRGQWVQASLLHTQIFMSDFQAARWLQEGEVARAVGNDHPTIRPTGLFKTADGYINIATVPEMWPRFCAALGREELETAPGFATLDDRLANSDRLSEEIEATTSTDTSAAWIAKFNGAGIPCGPVYSMDQVFADEQVKHMGVAADVPSPTLGTLHQVGSPLIFSRTPSVLWTGAPERGADTDAVLGEFGFSDDEIAGLRATGAI